MDFITFKESQVQYDRLREHKNYRMNRDIYNHIKILSDCIPSKTILNYGSGNSPKDEFGIYKRFKIVNYDIGVKEFENFPDTIFDGVICLNVLEYIPEELLVSEIKKIFSKAKRWVIIEIGYLYNDRIMSHKGIHEWKRLIHKYNTNKLPLYIKSEYDFKIPRTKYPELPKIDNKRIIIVGNAISALNDEFGEEIDKFDLVIRIGDGVENSIKYPKQIGTKTDICVMGDYKYFLLLNRNKFMYDMPIITSKARSKISHETSANFFEQEPYTLFNNQELVELSLNLGCPGYKHMSTGLLTILYFLQKHETESISIVGFDNFSNFSNKKKTKSEKEILPYYSIQQELLTKNVNTIHDSGFENNILSNLEKEGKLIWLNKKYTSSDNGKVIEIKEIS